MSVNAYSADLMPMDFALKCVNSIQTFIKDSNSLSILTKRTKSWQCFSAPKFGPKRAECGISIIAIFLSIDLRLYLAIICFD